LNPAFVDKYKPTIAQMMAVKSGADFTDCNGLVHPNDAITLTPSKPRSYAYCTDTAYSEAIIPYIEGTSLLYHEATFMENLKNKAEYTFHSTARQAATIAQKAKVEKLLLGHFSSRYTDMQPLLEEAKSVFSNTAIAVDGMKIVIGGN